MLAINKKYGFRLDFQNHDINEVTKIKIIKKALVTFKTGKALIGSK